MEKVNPPSPESKEISRRNFLGISGSILGAAAITTTACTTITRIEAPDKQTYSIVPSRVIGANERINCAVIGFGMRGPNHVTTLKAFEKDPKRNIKLTHVCEIYDRRKEEIQK